MANRNSSNNSTDRTLRTVLLVLLAVLMLAYAFTATYKHEANPGKWWTNNRVEQPDKGGDDEGAGNSGLIAGDDVENNGIRFTAMSIPVERYNDYGVSAAAETALQLTVTPTPAGADLSDGKFSIKFKNASSTWASGKTLSQYVTLNSTDSTHATVSCLKAFGEQIIVVYTYTGESNNEIKTMTAEYPLDYAMRILDYTLKKNNTSAIVSGVENASKNIISFNDNIANGAPTMSDYTVTGNSPSTTTKVYIADKVFTALQGKGSSNAGQDAIWGSFGNMLTNLFGNDLIKTEAFRNVVTANNASGIIRINYVFETEYTRFEADFYLSINVSSLPIAPQGVQWNGGSSASGHVF